MAHDERPRTAPGPASRGGVTLKDVAQAAGVSISTASRALANNPHVSKATRRHVQQTARELNYVVNGLVRSMTGTGTRTVAFVTDAFLGEAFARMAQGVDMTLRRENAMLFLNSTQGFPEGQRIVIEQLARQRTSGVLLVGTQSDTDEHWTRIARYHDLLASVGARLVLCGVPAISNPKVSDIPTVSYDQRSGVQAATNALLDAGHRSIAFLGYSRRTTAMERFDGYRRAMRQAGLTVDPDDPMVIATGNVEEQIGPAALRLLDRDPAERPTAIVCTTDRMAHGVYRTARQLGLRLPEDLSVVGFDDLAADESLTPTLSTVNVPYEEIGRYAARLVLGLPVDRGEHPVFPVRFIPRRSIASPDRTATRSY
ncbi:LacI family DNA-binding transcriptional regulator [Bifidobacterium simiarum]|uniref:HTH lacI-type domain-containing protein n=1 Tax=Bifidobacterium simiarum TaxID=2045441 RepID=A0A2M9HH14_9BIFI|nr:LacI family DNA-binding transcriptional regulator [Bifidobacterium simiarum]PJM76106.1 hypothetical protein CSQ87_00790 [Bifidobacterium simiarum]